MPSINGKLLYDDIHDHRFTNKSLSVATGSDPNYSGPVSTKCIERASSPRRPCHSISTDNLKRLCAVLGTEPTRYSLTEPVQIFTRDTRPEQFRAYESIVRAIDENRVPERCWDYYLVDGECLLKRVLENPGEFTTCRSISPADWEAAFTDLRRRDIVIRLADRTYRVTGARGEEILEIIENRTALEVRAARSACGLTKAERNLILQEMELVLLDNEKLLAEAHPPKALIESEAQFHLTWAGRRGAMRRLLTYNCEVCKQLGDRLLRLDENDRVTTKPSYAREFHAMVSELQAIKEAFSRAKPDPDKIEALIRNHTERSKRLTRENATWFNARWKAPCERLTDAWRTNPGYR